MSSRAWSEGDKPTCLRPGSYSLQFPRAEMRKCDDAPIYSFFRGRWQSMRSLAKMYIFLKMPSFTLFITDLIRGTSWWQNVWRITFSNPAFQVRCPFYCAVGKSVCKHLPARDIVQEEDHEEKVSGAPVRDGCVRVSVPVHILGRALTLGYLTSEVLPAGLQLSEQPCFRLNSPGWVCFRCSPMEVARCLRITSSSPAHPLPGIAEAELRHWQSSLFSLPHSLWSVQQP